MTVDVEVENWRVLNMHKARREMVRRAAVRRAQDPVQLRRAVDCVRAAVALGLVAVEELADGGQ